MIPKCPKCKEDYSSSDDDYKHICPVFCCQDLKDNFGYDIDFFDWEPNWYIDNSEGDVHIKIFYCPFCGKKLNGR